MKYIFVFALLFYIKRTKCDVIVYSRNTGQVMEEFRDLPAHFGPSLPATGTRFLTIESIPKDGCGKIKEPPNFLNGTLVKWAVLIARYNCSFEEKVRQAEAASYDAAIVYNVGSNELEQMSAKSEEGIGIPSIFVGERTGQILLHSYKYTDQFAIIINDDLPFNINTNLIVPFSIVVGLCFITMIGFMVVKCVREQRRLRRHRLPCGALKKIPTKKFVKGDSYETCAICLDDYAEGDKLRLLPCSHAYHTKCIDPWLTKNRRVCPICKRKVFARGEPRPLRRRSSSDSVTDSDDDRRPLLNPVENSTNHGTFSNESIRDNISNDNSADGEGSSTTNSYQPAPRINPFDRAIAVVDSQSRNNEVNRWESFKRLFQRRTLNENPTLEDQPRSVLVHSNNVSATPVALIPRSASSNNILNKNLAGSFKDDGGSDTEHVLHENPNKLVTATSAPSTASTASTGRLGVAAIPNTNFNPLSVTTRKHNGSQVI